MPGRGSSELQEMCFRFMIKCTVMSVRWGQVPCLPHMLSSGQGLPSAPAALHPLLLLDLTHLWPWGPIASSDVAPLLKTPTAFPAKPPPPPHIPHPPVSARLQVECSYHLWALTPPLLWRPHLVPAFSTCDKH